MHGELCTTTQNFSEDKNTWLICEYKEKVGILGSQMIQEVRDDFKREKDMQETAKLG